MQESGLVKLMKSFADMPDPRVVGRTDHLLLDILVLTVCAVLCGVDDWEGVEIWGQVKLGWLRQFIALKNGIPSHDTIGRVFAAMDSANSRAALPGGCPPSAALWWVKWWPSMVKPSAARTITTWARRPFT